MSEVQDDLESERGMGAGRKPRLGRDACKAGSGLWREAIGFFDCHRRRPSATEERHLGLLVPVPWHHASPDLGIRRGECLAVRSARNVRGILEAAMPHAGIELGKKGPGWSPWEAYED